MFSKIVPALTKKSNDLKPLLLEVHKAALNRAKAENNINLDLLARVAVLKFLRSELNAQFAHALERCRTTLRGYEGVKQVHLDRISSIVSAEAKTSSACSAPSTNTTA